uniref:Peptidase_M3 domain-containing protein n=1 Tax=Macrostomum lignano TaxID=282301 RepID=A0A1I8FNH3_9PLAT
WFTMATTTTKKMPPGCLLSFPDSAEQLTKLSEISSPSPPSSTIATPASASRSRGGELRPAAGRVRRPIRPAAVRLDFVQHVFPDKAMRDASSEADKKISEHQILTVQDKLHTGGDSASAELTRYIERCVTDGRRNGLGLDEATRDRVKAIKTEMSSISIEFNRKPVEDVSSLLMDRRGAGRPAGRLSGQPGKGRETPASCDDEAAERPETRRRIELAFNTRCKEANLALLQRLLALRRERAKLLNYPDPCGLRLRMAKNADTVAKFLSNLSEKLKPLQAKEQARLLRGEAGRLRPAGHPVERLDYSVDHERLRQYFPIEKVTKGLLENLSAHTGTEVHAGYGLLVWNPRCHAVQCPRILPAASKSVYFYLDLYPRDGKYGHAACFCPPAWWTTAPTAPPPSAPPGGQFHQADAEKPSLLTHDEVETFFHEFGHAMHNLWRRTETYMFSGTSVERDFVEAPCLENWVWSKKSLALMSAPHYSTGEPIPDDLLQSLVASRLANTAFFNQRQIAIHTSPDPNLDICAEYARISNRILGIQPSEGSAFPPISAIWPGGYDAQYYGYMWSEVYSADMFCTGFGEDKVLSPEAGGRLPQPGGSRDAVDMLRDFLGRDPTDAAPS